MNPYYLWYGYLIDSFTVIYWTSQFVILGVSGLFRFNSIFDGKSCKQTLKTMIRRHVMWRLILVCTVCLLPFYGFPGKNGLKYEFHFSEVYRSVNCIGSLAKNT